MKKYTFYLAFLFGFIAFNSNAQEGIIRGVLVDEETLEPLIGATVRIVDGTAGAITDMDGAYSINVPSGVYSVVHSYLGYQDKRISEVEVIENEVNSLGQLTLGMGGEKNEIDAVVISATIQKNTSSGLLNFQRQSSKIVDAISAESISKTGDSDVAAVVKRIPGVTIKSGKYVYVRGLGDRYTKTILNGLQIPGLDPNKNAVQLDIFPSNIIDNIVVYKTFSPDLSGDFTGGMVDITTKDFPLEKTIKFSTSFGLNTNTTFNENYINQGDLNLIDLTGFGKFDRELPFPKSFEVGQASDYELYYRTAQLNNSAEPVPVDNFLNSNVSLSYGNQFDVSEKNQLGVNAAITYKNDYSYRDNVDRNNYNIRKQNGSYEMDITDDRLGQEGYNEGMVNGLLALALKNNSNKYSLKFLHTRTGESSASVRSNDDSFNDLLVQETTVDYFQRTLSNALISGEHFLHNESIIDWSASGTYSTVDNPDRTSTVMEYENSDITASNLLFTSGSTYYNKQWRELAEKNVSAKASYEIPLTAGVEGTMIKFGTAATFKVRDFEIYNVSIDKSNPFDPDLSLIEHRDLSQILAYENIIAPSRDGYQISNVVVDADNAFVSDQTVLAGYAMTDFRFTDQLKFIGGLRVENAIMHYDGQIRNEAGAAIDFDGESLNSKQYLPSANLIFEPIDYMNVRVSYNKTLARPSFKEKSGAIIYDAINDQRFYGNINLVETSVNNFDMRWEYFFTDSEIVSISPFYKSFTDPIELTFVTGNEVKPLNKEDANVYGFEIEARKNLGFLGGGIMENFAINTNFTLVKSEIPLSENEKLKYSQNGLSVPTNRDMLGQAPYSINANLAYSGLHDNGWEANFAYNVKGKTLSIVGIANIPNVYEDPFHHLDFKVSKQLRGKLNSKISLKARNLLNDQINYFYQFPGLANHTYQSYEIGQSFSLGYSLELN